MQVDRIHEGLWRWAVAGADGERACAYLEHGDAMLLVDPVLPPPGDDLDRFRRAIERDLERLGGPVHVMLTRKDDPRDAEALIAMTGGRQWAPGQAPPAGVEVIPTGLGAEVALWSPAHAALMPGRAMRVEGGAAVPVPGADATALLAVAAQVVIPSVGPMTPGTR